MTKPMIRIHNTETDEVVDREMTDAEFEIYEQEQEAIFLAETEAAEKAAAKAALLAKMGLTTEEAKILLS